MQIYDEPGGKPRGIQSFLPSLEPATMGMPTNGNAPPLYEVPGFKQIASLGDLLFQANEEIGGAIVGFPAGLSQMVDQAMSGQLGTPADILKSMGAASTYALTHPTQHPGYFLLELANLAGLSTLLPGAAAGLRSVAGEVYPRIRGLAPEGAPAVQRLLGEERGGTLPEGLDPETAAILDDLDQRMTQPPRAPVQPQAVRSMWEGQEGLLTPEAQAALERVKQQMPRDVQAEQAARGGLTAEQEAAAQLDNPYAQLAMQENQGVTPGADISVARPGVSRVISGGQDGVDMAGLDAAQELGIPTGGTAAAGWRQSTGKGQNISRPWLADKYGLVEGQAVERPSRYGSGTYQDVYSQRTVANAQEADGTIWFGRPDSPGGKLTLGGRAQAGKPAPLINPTDPQQIRDWVIQNNIKTVNVAGNREFTNPGIYQRAKDILVEGLDPARMPPGPEQISTRARIKYDPEYQALKKAELEAEARAAQQANPDVTGAGLANLPEESIAGQFDPLYQDELRMLNTYESKQGWQNLTPEQRYALAQARRDFPSEMKSAGDTVTPELAARFAGQEIRLPRYEPVLDRTIADRPFYRPPDWKPEPRQPATVEVPADMEAALTRYLSGQAPGGELFRDKISKGVDFRQLMEEPPLGVGRSANPKPVLDPERNAAWGSGDLERLDQPIDWVPPTLRERMYLARELLAERRALIERYKQNPSNYVIAEKIREVEAKLDILKNPSEPPPAGRYDPESEYPGPGELLSSNMPGDPKKAAFWNPLEESYKGTGEPPNPQIGFRDHGKLTLGFDPGAPGVETAPRNQLTPGPIAPEEMVWISSERMTGGVTVRDGIITDAPPIMRKFIGQPLTNLERWLSKQGGFQEVNLGPTPQQI